MEGEAFLIFVDDIRANGLSRPIDLSVDWIHRRGDARPNSKRKPGDAGRVKPMTRLVERHI
jgi:hypothetical protein